MGSRSATFRARLIQRQRRLTSVADDGEAFNDQPRLKEHLQVDRPPQTLGRVQSPGWLQLRPV